MSDPMLHSLAEPITVLDSDRAASAVSARESELVAPTASRPPDSLAEYAVEQIRNDLLMGKLRPGSRLTADAIAEQLGISHIPVREAFRFLEAQGHLQRDGRRGARITPTSPGEATDIYLTPYLDLSSGNVIVNVAPLPGPSLAATIVPPCC